MIKERPWIWVIIGFVSFVAALGVVLTICIRNSPQSVPLNPAPAITHGI